MTFKNLNDAIALEVGFQMQGYIEGHMNLQIDTPERRKDYWFSEVVELRANSGFTTDAEFRLITAAFVIEAVKIKVDAYFRSRLVGDGWLLHYASGGKPMHCKTDYKVMGAALRAMAKLNARQGGGYAVSTHANYVASKRARIVINMMSRQPVLESTGTPYSCSVASESYWSN
jgi:hypothetical protein